MECTVVRDEMMDVLYGEASVEARKRVQEHEAVCAACREEMAALRRVRRELTRWKVPRSGAGVVSLRRLPRLAVLAAAAAIVLAVGGVFALGGADVSYDRGGIALRVGAPAGAPPDVQALLARAEERHRDEMGALRAELLRVAPASEDALLAQVGEMIRQSEERQGQRLQAGLVELSEQAEAQRRYDLARMSAGLAYLDGKTGQQAARTTELMGYVLQAAQKK